MPKYRKVDATAIERTQKLASRRRPVSPEQAALVKRMKTIADETIVCEATLGPDEKSATVRQQLLRAAKLADVEIAVKKSPHGFYFGLMTLERRSNRGRKEAA
jgi:hypothetical protein